MLNDFCVIYYVGSTKRASIRFGWRFSFSRSRCLSLKKKGIHQASVESMTSLFRPWTSEEVVPGKSGFDGLRADKPDSPLTPNDGACSEVDKKFEINVEDREVRYKSVKEHMRKRSEKYWLKRCKLTEELKPEITVKPEPGTQWPEVSCASFPVAGCAPAAGFLNPGLDFLPSCDVRCHLDAAVGHGFPGNLFEEYARFLTEQQKQVAERTRKQRPKKFRCPHCQVGFSNNGQLKGHIRIHTGERPFKCDAESCGKSFTRNEELTRHRRIHSGLRPFPCSECGKRFGRKDHLKKHVKTHYQQRARRAERKRGDRIRTGKR